MNADECLVSIHAHLYGWLVASLRPGNRDGAAAVVAAFKADGCVPFAVKGAFRDRERLLADLAGLVIVKGDTRDRRLGLTWPGVCRAVALTVGAGEIAKAFTRMEEIAGHAAAAGGPDVSPDGAVPEFLLAPALGAWWQDCEPGKQSMRLARARLFDELLPALVMRWETAAADCHGRRWYRLTPAGVEALAKPPAIPRGLPKRETLTDLYIAECDAAWEAACRACPSDRNEVFIPLPAARWWPVKGGKA